MATEKKEPTTQWILLRGLAREARHWGSFPQDLADAISKVKPEARADCIDLPGAGCFSEMKCPLSIPEMTEFVRGKLLEMRQRQREAAETPAPEVYLVAFSLGGMVASEWLHRWPDEIKGCVLINTSFKGYSPIYHRLVPTALRHLAGAVRGKSAQEQERHVLRMVSNRSEAHDRLVKEWSYISETRPVRFENVARQLLAASRYQPALEAPPVSVLVLNSLKDAMVHPSCSEAIARRWGAELRRHPTAGHDLAVDEPEWTVDQIQDWYMKGSQ